MLGTQWFSTFHIRWVHGLIGNNTSGSFATPLNSHNSQAHIRIKPYYIVMDMQDLSEVLWLTSVCERIWEKKATLVQTSILRYWYTPKLQRIRCNSCLDVHNCLDSLFMNVYTKCCGKPYNWENHNKRLVNAYPVCILLVAILAWTVWCRKEVYKVWYSSLVKL